MLLVTGGFGCYDPRSLRSSTEVYYPSAGEWTQVGDLPRSMEGLHAVTLNNKILIFGEMIILNVCLSVIKCLCGIKVVWTMKMKLMRTFWSTQSQRRGGPKSGRCQQPDVLTQFPLLTLITLKIIVSSRFLSYLL